MGHHKRPARAAFRRIAALVEDLLDRVPQGNRCAAKGCDLSRVAPRRSLKRFASAEIARVDYEAAEAARRLTEVFIYRADAKPAHSRMPKRASPETIVKYNTDVSTQLITNAGQKPTPPRSIAGIRKNIGRDGKTYQEVAWPINIPPFRCP